MNLLIIKQNEANYLDIAHSKTHRRDVLEYHCYSVEKWLHGLSYIYKSPSDKDQHETWERDFNHIRFNFDHTLTLTSVDFYDNLKEEYLETNQDRIDLLNHMGFKLNYERQFVLNDSMLLEMF